MNPMPCRNLPYRNTRPCSGTYGGVSKGEGCAGVHMKDRADSRDCPPCFFAHAVRCVGDDHTRTYFRKIFYKTLCSLFAVQSVYRVKEVEFVAYQSYRPEGFEALVAKHENRLYRTALAVLGHVSDAEDVVQEVFLRVYEKAPELESEEHETAWLLRVTVNLCRSRLRTPWRKRMEPLLESYPAAEPEQRELLEHVLALSPRYRAVIHLFYYEGYSVKEIAQLTGQRESTVRSLLTRARQKLKSVLQEDDDESI